MKLIPKAPCILGMGAQLNVYEHDIVLTGQEQLNLCSLHWRLWDVRRLV